MKVRHIAVLFPLGVLLFLAACGEDNDAPRPALAAAVSATATTLTVTGGSVLPTGGGTIQIDAERIGYKKRDGNSLSGLIRGVQGTTAAAHAAGAPVHLISSQPPETPAPTSTATITPVPSPTATQAVQPTVTKTSPPPPATQTPTGTSVVATSTPTGTSGGPTFTPTQTSGIPTSTPSQTQGVPTSTPTATLTVSPTLTLEPTPGGEAKCGNGIPETGEECDDGNLWGADGCAANCTHEVPAGCMFGCVNEGQICSGATVTTVLFQIDLKFDGDQTLMAGHPRSELVETTDPELSFKPNEIPVTLRAADLHVPPVKVPGLVCACVRGEATDQFGPVGPDYANSGSGSIGCDDTGLADVDYLFTVDHNVTPGDPNNGGGLPDDPGCVNGERVEDGSRLHPHTGACNSKGSPHFTGGGPRNSMVILSSTSITLIDDKGKCATGNCSIADYGPDCTPCTSDDLVHDAPSSLATTTGVASVRMYDANDYPGVILDAAVTGAMVDCDALLGDPNHPDLSGSALVSAFGKVDQERLGDAATTSVFACVVP
jgi:cysteine-rich repeat protein